MDEKQKSDADVAEMFATVSPAVEAVAELLCIISSNYGTTSKDPKELRRIEVLRVAMEKFHEQCEQVRALIKNGHVAEAKKLMIKLTTDISEPESETKRKQRLRLFNDVFSGLDLDKLPHRKKRT